MLTSAAVIPRLSCLFYNVSTHSFRPYLANHPIFQKTEKKKTLPVQIPHPIKEKFEFPTPGHNKRWSNAWGMRGKGMLK